MSTPPPQSNDPFGTPDAEQVARNEAQRRAREEQAARDYAEYMRQQQAAQHGAAPQGPAQQQWGQQQWSSQNWQGQNQPGYPAYPGQPGYSPYPGYGYQVQPKAPGTATAAMIFGILSFVLFPPLGIVALILAISARRKIKRTGSQGKGPATAGLILGSLSTAFTVIGLGALIVAVSLVMPANVNVSEPKTIDTRRADIGHCLGVLPETNNDLQYSLVPCDDPHAAEIINIRSYYEYPTTDAQVRDEVLQCVNSSYPVPTELNRLGKENFDALAVLPTAEEWDSAAAADMHCLVTPKTGKLKGSLVEGTAELVP